MLAPGTTSDGNFPPGYVAHAEAAFDYLLASPACARADALGAAGRFGAGGVLCMGPAWNPLTRIEEARSLDARRGGEIP